MLSVTNKSGPFVAPQADVNPAFEEAKKTREGVREAFNFDKVVGESNNKIAAQMEEDKKAIGEGGELKIGESKNDKEFREMLERVSGRKQDKLKNKLDKDDYLNLMVTQLKYQDPTKPMENHEMATQLAQFNTVEQLINVNKSLTDMSNQNAQANVDRLTPYLGKLVEVTGSKFKVTSSQAVNQGSVDLGAAAGSVSVLIKDSNGTVVRTLGLGEKDMGRHAIEWDGKTDGGLNAKPGDYTFEVQASTIDGKEMKTKTSFMTKVDAITDLTSGGKLETSSGRIEAKDVLAIRPDNSMTTMAQQAPAAAMQAPASLQSPAAKQTSTTQAPATNAAPMKQAAAKKKADAAEMNQAAAAENKDDAAKMKQAAVAENKVDATKTKQSAAAENKASVPNVKPEPAQVPVEKVSQRESKKAI